MNWEIEFRKAAAKDFNGGYDHYEKEKAGLGEDFAKCVQDAIDVLKMNPKVHPIVYKEVRRAVVQRFPYCIYYIIKSNRVHIVSVFHTSQNPRKWQSRVR